ncbi:MAG: ASCH domain-containing protein [Candidatus Nealsonbacteria bacterium]|nr:ASCH domain-containing protein [Candidatus Nealsonbacteria bacterium]
MKAITIEQPWASAIMAGVKRVENRTWATAHRGPLAIHAGKTVDPTAEESLRAAGIDPAPFRNAPRGAILGTVELVDVVRLNEQRTLPGYADDLTEDPLATGPICWVLASPRPLAEPIPYRGQQGLWRYR